MDHCRSILSTTCLCVCTALCMGAAPTQDTTSFLQAHPGARAMTEGGELVAIYGVPLAINTAGANLDDFVDDFLSDNAGALGLPNLQRTRVDKITIRNGKFTVYTYRQDLEGLPVHGSQIKIPVLLGAPEKIGYVGIDLMQPPASPLPQDVLSATDAVDVVQQSAEYGHLTGFATPEKVIFKATDESLHRTWRFIGSDDDEAYRFFVDTQSGQIVGVQDQVRHATVSGTVTGYRTPGTVADDSANPNSCPNQPATCAGGDCAVPMAGVQVCAMVDDQPIECVFAGADGVYELTVPDSVPVTVEGKLIGEWVTVESHEWYPFPHLSPTAPANPPATADLVFNDTVDDCAPWPDEYDTAQVNAFLRYARNAQLVQSAPARF